MTQNDLNIAQDNANREMVAISVEMDQLRARIVALGQGNGFRRSSSTDFLWEAHDRIMDARTNLEMALGMNR